MQYYPHLTDLKIGLIHGERLNSPLLARFVFGTISMISGAFLLSKVFPERSERNPLYTMPTIGFGVSHALPPQHIQTLLRR